VGESDEVVWCRRIDPARALIDNIPLPDSGRRHGDIVLHDGAPNGERILNERVVPVVDELELWQASEISTVTAQLTCPHQEDVEAVTSLFDQAALPIETRLPWRVELHHRPFRRAGQCGDWSSYFGVSP
jgi:hypothetical protein